MTYDPRENARVRNPVLLIAAVMWVLLLIAPHNIRMLAHCPATSSGAMPEPPSMEMLLAVNPPASLAAGWFVMLVAMMSPVIIPPLCHIWQRSFAHRRTRSIVLFLTGYAAIWMAAGAVLLSCALAVDLVTPQSYLPASAAVLMAAVWQSSPVKQRSLNRCHAHTELAAFGPAADRDAFRFGLAHGIWCVGSCWALMLVPMLLPSGHHLAMALVAVVMCCERFERPMPPRWRWRGLGKAIRIALAQSRIRLISPVWSYAASRGEAVR